jgi:beta-phosphoglucomutase-like phosphatase (HAD superfamily)
MTALNALADEGDRVIGFEDSMRGYNSLKQAGISSAVLICPPSHPQLQIPADDKRLYVPSFTEVQKLFI